MLFESVLITDLGADKFTGLWNGTTDWAGADVTKAISDFKKLLTYTNNDRDTFDWTDAEKLVMDGKAGYQLMGDWEAADLDAKKFTDYALLGLPGQRRHLPVAGRLVRAAQGRQERRRHQVLAEDRRLADGPEGVQHQEGLDPGPYRRRRRPTTRPTSRPPWPTGRAVEAGPVLRPRLGLLAGLAGCGELGASASSPPTATSPRCRRPSPRPPRSSPRSKQQFSQQAAAGRLRRGRRHPRPRRRD